MTLADEYRRQRSFRDLVAVGEFVPLRSGEIVLDLGCGVGDWALDFASRGARVIGLDGNDELLEAARARATSNVEFRKADLAKPLPVEETVDGVFGSFVAAYFLDLDRALESWTAHLRVGGWVVLIEIDDLFGHEPVTPETRRLLDAYSEDGLRARRYDFRMGGKLTEFATRAGLRVIAERTFADREFAFSGPASSEVLAAWSKRLERMGLLRSFCGGNWDSVREDFLACLARPDHRSNRAVRGIVAIRDAR